MNIDVPASHYALYQETNGGIQVQFHTFLILALDGGGFPDSCPTETAPSIHQLDNQVSCVLWKTAGSATLN
jgi:hypothetical protein